MKRPFRSITALRNISGYISGDDTIILVNPPILNRNINSSITFLAPVSHSDVTVLNPGFRTHTTHHPIVSVSCTIYFSHVYALLKIRLHSQR